MEIILWLASPQLEELHYRVAALESLRTTAVDLQLQSEQAQAHLIIPQIPQTNQILMYH